MTQVHGIHHVTAIAADPQENLDFYAGILALEQRRGDIEAVLPPLKEPAPALVR